MTCLRRTTLEMVALVDQQGALVSYGPDRPAIFFRYDDARPHQAPTYSIVPVTVTYLSMDPVTVGSEDQAL